MMYVLTGGPCCGKTMLLAALARRGYATVPEAARRVFEEEGRKEHGTFPWSNLPEFQRRVCRTQMAAEEGARSCPVFMDRSLVDQLAYCALGNISPPEELATLPPRSTTIFLLEPIPYTPDEARRESPEEARRVHAAVTQMYNDHGYALIHVPLLPLEERVDFVLQHIPFAADKISPSGLFYPQQSHMH